VSAPIFSTMQSSTVRGGARVTEAVAESPRRLRPSERVLLGLVVAGAAFTVLIVALPSTVPVRLSARARGEAAVLGAAIVSGLALSCLAVRPRAWRGTRLLAVGIVAAALFQAAGWFFPSFKFQAPSEQFVAEGVGLLLFVYLGAFGLDFFEHIRHERAQLLSDVGLLAVLTGAGVYVMLQGSGGEAAPTWRTVITVLTATASVLVVAGWGVLSLWCPTMIHLGLFACAAALGGSAITLDRAYSADWSPLALAVPEVTTGLSLLASVAILVIEGRLYHGRPRPPHAVWWIRPALLATAIVGTGVLLVVTLASPDLTLATGEALSLGLVVLAALGGRMIVSQVAMARAAGELEDALGRRESAIASLKAAADVVASSEARLRLLLDAAVDGLVELGPSGAIVRANAAFCSMIHLPQEEVLGRSWDELAARSGAGRSLASLLDTGQAVLVAEGGTSYLEARSSAVPTSPPGRLLMIRDVTASKVAEQTIRTLNQFLQDRDEDRTRLLRRTNAAIEGERNRIARDLHDGPIQGVSAAALSLEAVKLMLESGDVTGGRELLRKVVAELSEEAVNLRRVMSDLRPPLLEQRGLIPAVIELCARAQRELQIPVKVVTSPNSEVPNDVETLAYRVVQEALSNISKHSFASNVAVRIETAAGNLQVEISDDGQGFDPTNARDFLASGKVGLASMRERAELAGGTFTIRSAPGSGTIVMAILPFELLTPMSRQA